MTTTPDRSRCVVLTPVAHTIEPQCELALRELESMGYPVLRVRGQSDIARGRSLMATQVLEQGYEAIMWIDSDMLFFPSDVDSLRTSGHALIGGIYAFKGVRRLAFRPLPGVEEVVFGEAGRVVEVQYAPTGFLYSHRSLYDDIRVELDLPMCGEEGERVVPYFLSLVVPDGSTMAYLSEDYSFCHRARQVGHRVMADTRIRLGHIGAYVYTIEDAGRERVIHSSCRFALREPTAPG